MAPLGVKDAIDTGLKWIDAHFSLRHFLMFFLLCAAFVFLVNPVLVYLGLPPLPPIYRTTAVAGMVLFGVGTVFFSVEKVVLWVRDRWHKHKWRVAIKEHLHNLPADQFPILLRFGQTRASSVVLHPSNGAVCDLEQRGILYRSANVGNVRDGFAYSLTPEALHYFRGPEFQKLLLNQKFD
jgi:hypothetical protein